MRQDTYFNGTFGYRAELSVPLSDRSLYFGDAVYDAAIGKNGKIFLCQEHIERLYRSAEKIGISPRVGKEELFRVLCDMTKECMTPFFLYFQFSRDGKNIRTHAYPDDAGCNLLILRDPLAAPVYDEPISLITAEDLRYFYCDVKTVNLLPAVLASKRAALAGAEETVLHRGSRVTECAHSNISILKDGVLITHPLDCRILAGISREHLLAAAARLGIPVRERAFTLRELFAADEILVTSASKICRRASRLDGKPVAMRDGTRATLLCDAMFDEWDSDTAS